MKFKFPVSRLQLLYDVFWYFFVIGFCLALIMQVASYEAQESPRFSAVFLFLMFLFFSVLFQVVDRQLKKKSKVPVGLAGSSLLKSKAERTTYIKRAKKFRQFSVLASTAVTIPTSIWVGSMSLLLLIFLPFIWFFWFMITARFFKIIFQRCPVCADVTLLKFSWYQFGMTDSCSSCKEDFTALL